MDVIGIILDLVILAALAVGVLVWRSFSSGVEQGARDQATEMIKEINWPAELGRVFAQTRGTEPQHQAG